LNPLWLNSSASKPVILYGQLSATTEHSAAMLSALLRGEQTTQVSLAIVRLRLGAIEELARKVAYHDRGRDRALRVVPGGVVFRAGIDFAAPWLDYF
jgi:hypothetical protein